MFCFSPLRLSEVIGKRRKEEEEKCKERSKGVRRTEAAVKNNEKGSIFLRPWSKRDQRLF